MKRGNKISCLIIAGTLALCTFAGCGESAPETPGTPGTQNTEKALFLDVQCETVCFGECNAFSVNAQNLPSGLTIDYQLGTVSDGETVYTTVHSTKEKTLAYRCTSLGTYSVRAAVNDGTETIYSVAKTYTVVGDGGETLGTSPMLEYPSINVDLTGDYGEHPQIVHKSVRNYTEECAYFKGVYANRFVVSAYVDLIGTNYDDQHPKSGIVVRNGKIKYYIAFDFKPTFSHKDVVFVNYNGSSWQWPGTVYQASSCEFRGVNNERLKNKLTLVRDKEDFYFFVNDVYLGSKHIVGFTAETTVGTLTMSQNSVFSDYSCFVEGTAEFESALTKAKAQALKRVALP